MTDHSKSSKWLSSGQRVTQEETLERGIQEHKLFIGIPKDELFQETRVPLVPSAVKSLTDSGHKVVIEHGVGVKSSFTDHDYSEAGAQIYNDKGKIYEARVLLKTAPPTKEEERLLQRDQVLISPLTIPFTSREYLEVLKEKRIIAIATEYLKDASGAFPLVRSMSEIAGMSVISTANYLLSTANGGRGKLLGSVTGVAPARVVILGAGIVAEYASRAALGLGAQVHVYDQSIYKLMRLRRSVSQNVYTSSFDMEKLIKDLKEADVVIGAVHSTEGRSPIMVTEEMVMNMKKGSVIMDVSIDQGGCFETSEVTTHENPIFWKHGVIHYCVPNITSVYPQTASRAISNVIAPLLMAAGLEGGLERLIQERRGLRNGVYAFRGCITNVYLSKRFNLKYTNLDLIVPSRF